jgi:hypothetical protein
MGLKPTGLRVCTPRASSNTLARVRRATPDRGAEDMVGLSGRPKHFLQEQVMLKLQEITAKGYERVVVFRDNHEFYCCIAVYSTKTRPGVGRMSYFSVPQ